VRRRRAPLHIRGGETDQHCDRSGLPPSHGLGSAHTRHPERFETLMRFTSQTSSDGVAEQFFTLDEIPGVLWTPEGACGTRPLILLGHGGRQHKTAPGTVSRARRYAAEGFAVVAIDASNHGDRPQDEEFGRIAAQMRAGVAAGESPGELVA